MKILMMADTPADPNRGAAGTEVQTLRALRALGHDVDALWADDLGRRIAHGNLHLLLELPRTYERAAVAALRKKDYDVVHVNQPHGYRAARAVHRLSPRTVFVHRSHGFELNVEETLAPFREQFDRDARGRLRRAASSALAPLLRRHSYAIAAEADGHIVSSSLDAAFLRGRLGVPEERVAVIAQAVPDSFVRDPPPMMLDERLRRVLYVGQSAFVKAPNIVAAAINELAETEPSLRFTWVTEGDVRPLLDAQASRRTEVRPWIAQEALRDLYDAHGIFLFPSFYEGFGKAFLEAMSRGLCVVASDTGGAHDLIESGVNGILVPLGDSAMVAAGARELYHKPGRAQLISARATLTARAYTWERVARETVAFYERLRAMRT